MNGASEPAGFWRRYLAWCLDWLLLSPVAVLVLRGPLLRAWQSVLELMATVQQQVAELVLAPGLLVSPLALANALLADPVLRQALAAAAAGTATGLGLAALQLATVAALYFIGFEASRWHATPGKRALGIAVSDLQGRGVTLPRASLRFLAGFLSWLTLNLGHALAGLRHDRRALHDLLAGTRVISHGPMPRWARLALLAQGLLLAALLLALAARLAWVAWALHEAGVF